MIELLTRLTNNPASVAKFIVALCGAVGIAVSQGLLPETAGSWATVVVGFLTALGVYAVPNTPVMRKATQEEVKDAINGN